MTLALSKIDAAEQIAQLIKECGEGIGDREDEAVGLATLWLLDVEEVRTGFAEARDVRPEAKREATRQPKPGVAAGLLSVKRRKIGPLPDPEARSEVGPQKTDAAPRVSGGFAAKLNAAITALDAPQPEPLVQHEAKAALLVPEIEVVTTPPTLSKAAPMDNARAFARDRLCQNGVLATYYFHEDWWQWNGRFYEKAPAERIIGAAYQYLDHALVRTANGEERFRPKPEHAEALIKCLKACVAIDDRDTPPRWLDVRHTPAAENLLVFRNLLVDAETGEITNLTPHLWVQDGVDFEFDPQAQCPRWERFLSEVFPDDYESQATIEEQLGYGITNDTRLEKGALWVGEKRSGKSTLAWVQERLVGAGAFASLSFHDWMKTENSRAHLIGKKIAVFPDVRLKPAKNYGLTGYDPGGIDHQSAQWLLNIIGRDTVAIGRKFREVWQGRLSVKIIITTNEVPNLQDAGGVLASRFIMLEFKQSFFGREDVTLRDQLERELPGIANRCLAAYRRLRERGRFIQPEAGLPLIKRVEQRVSPFAAFMDDCFIEHPGGYGVVVDDFFKRFQRWCRDNRRHDLIPSSTKSNLIQEVKRIEQWKLLRSVKAHGEKRRYPGIKPRPSDDD